MFESHMYSKVCSLQKLEAIRGAFKCFNISKYSFRVTIIFQAVRAGLSIRACLPCNINLAKAKQKPRAPPGIDEKVVLVS